MKYDLFIVGGGAAGMAAAVKASESGLSVLLVERDHDLGGVLNQCIHNGFGLSYFQENITGTDYAARFKEVVYKKNVEIMTDTDLVRINEDRTAVISGINGVLEVEFTFCIMATGCREKSPYSLFIGGTRPAGIFTAGEAQKMINLGHYDIGERFVILGSGNVGLIMARRLKMLGKEVVAVVEQNERPGGFPANRRDCLEAWDIPVILRATVDTVFGIRRVSAVRIKYLDSEDQGLIPCDSLICATGLIPDRAVVENLKQGDKYPQWLYFCGNCESVHEIVDAVSMQAENTVSEICGLMEERRNA